MPTTNADTPVQGTSLEEAAKLMEGLLDLPEEADTETPSTDAADAAPAESESVAAKATQETPEPEEEQVEEAEATDAEETAETAAEKTAMVTVKIDGKSEVIPLEEVVKGYQRQADYSRKMDALVADRQKLETETRAERTTYQTMLVALRAQLQETQPEEPDWNEVYRTDPVGYARRRDEWRDKQEKIAAANFELERVRNEERKEQGEKLKQVVEQGRRKMTELFPAWKDPKVWEADRQRIVEYALSPEVGYTREEIAAAYDPRAIVFLNKARLYDELMANKPKPAAVKRPQVAPAGASRDSNSSSRLNAAQQRLAKSGRIEDAARVFEQLI